MKKLLLSFAAGVMALSMTAAETSVDFDFVNKDYGFQRKADAYIETPATITEGAVTLTIDKTAGNGYRLWTDGLRIYKTGDGNATIAVAAPEAVNEISFTVKTKFTTVEVEGKAAAYDESTKTYTWKGSAEKPVITVTQTAGNYSITNLKVTYGGTYVPEEPETPAENYKKVTKVTADSSYVFVASGKYNALYSKNYGYMSATNVPKEATATGFNGEAAAAIKYVAVEGGYNLVTTEGKYLGAKADYNTFDTTDDSAANRVWTVSIDKDGKATVTNVATNKIVMQDPNYGSFGCYNAEDAANYVLPELYELTPVTSTPVEPVEPELVKAKSIKDVIALEAKTKFVAEFAMTVGWVFKSNVFVCDEAGDFIQIYGSNTLKVGDVIPAGLEGTYDLFNDTPEIVDATIPEATAGTFEAKAVAAADINNGLVNSVVTINDVVFAEDTPSTKDNFAGISEGVELSFRNNYTIEGVAAGTYNVTVVVTVFKGAPSLYVINYEKATGVADINASDNAPVEYFNLQGVRVANPENGLYIRRQGTNVQKVMVR